ncbi:MAG TPA: glycosyltransferase family 2 protein, partial [Pseudonocardiaceae bacterium]|nr:glycosyltransferase family 2 protein [Pseudonocardiaceae bacterium]
MPFRARTEPVLAVLVCHDGEPWLRPALSALRALSPRPRHILAVDTGSSDRTPVVLAAAAEGPDAVVDGVLTLSRDTGFGAAVHAAVDHGVNRWGDPGRWLWLLHDDSAPEPDCLGVLLRSAEVSPSAGLLGPLALDWADPRLVVEAGVSTDASGHRQTGVGPTELDWSRFESPSGNQETFEQSTEVLAVSSAGALIRREVWDELGGYDPALALLRDDVDFGWRVNRSGRVALCVPSARLRHARALTRGLRPADALTVPVRAADRAHGVRTVLVNCTTVGFLVGLPRLVLLCVARAAGFTLLRRLSDARAELGTIAYLLRGRADLRAARTTRRATARAGGGAVRGLLTTRTTRLRNVFSGGITNWTRRRAAADAALNQPRNATPGSLSGTHARLRDDPPTRAAAPPGGAHALSHDGPPNRAGAPAGGAHALSQDGSPAPDPQPWDDSAASDAVAGGWSGGSRGGSPAPDARS